MQCEWTGGVKVFCFPYDVFKHETLVETFVSTRPTNKKSVSFLTHCFCRRFRPITFCILSLHSLPICVKWKWNCLKIHGIELIPYLIEFIFLSFLLPVRADGCVCVQNSFFFLYFDGKKYVIQPDFNRLKLRIVVLRAVIWNFTFSVSDQTTNDTLTRDFQNQRQQ